MSDILFHTDDYIFSYRVAGILIHEDKVLLQKASNDSGFAFPGGHVAFFETNAETLIREFKEEMGAHIKVKELKWVAEIFFPWGDKPCHQICLYYNIELADETQIPLNGVFRGWEYIGGRTFDIEFHWISLDDIGDMEIYPKDAAKLLTDKNDVVKHFVYKE